ncbi:hypothetical protein SELMODRAFT_440996 [Selaginella moellendorffii]|uniref:RNA helicase n=1 Tax=Selaginella moellendorffii TaxID=88036 RepID=D8RFX1_SELML|nr:DEAD-box ATP-dependent RNA helicase 16 [Selaginella moellendorffii]EFJ28935.1 hypothetical protein SELMODRAFT_440996 [Selaginella moellendorffii]|eukprot:XP_002969811.1 DEAD-box ATP-dependent RNA helicase 16 [Selaginella moellendorffii]
MSHGDGEDEEEALGFEELGLDPRLLRAIAKRGLPKPTLIQQTAIPRILEGKDVVGRAKTGSGKTFAYLLPMIHKLLAHTENATGLKALVLVPTRELCQQVFDELESLLNFSGGVLTAVQLTTSMSSAVVKGAVTRRPNIVVSTPGCVASCIADGTISAPSLKESLATLVLDEADLLLSYGYEEDLQKLVLHVPPRCQCILMSATTSADVDKLKKLVLHDPVTLTLTEVDGSTKDDVVPSTVQQFMVRCEAEDKLLHLLTLVRFELIQKKALIFVNAIDTSFKIKLFLEQFGIKSAVLNAELPQNSRLHILKEFNLGLFDYMIATDDGKSDKLETEDQAGGKLKNRKKLKKRIMDAEFGVVRGVDFKNVYTVVNFDLPRTVTGYIHRIGRTGRAGNAGVAVSFVCEGDEGLLSSLEDVLSGDSGNAGEKRILPFPTITSGAVESLRYRAEDVARGVTKISIREARAKELKMEILNSERLKAHFEDNPADLKLLKHDKPLSKRQPPQHLRSVPEYLRDAEVMAAGKAMKAANAAIGRPSVSYTKKRKQNWEQDPLKSIGKKHKRGGKPGRTQHPGRSHKNAHSSKRSHQRRKR